MNAVRVASRLKKVVVPDFNLHENFKEEVIKPQELKQKRIDRNKARMIQLMRDSLLAEVNVMKRE